MKNLMKSKFPLLVLLLNFAIFNVNAQIFSGIPSTPANPLPGPIPVTNVTNTGVSAIDFFGIPAIGSVCDGDVPRINVIHGANNLTEPIGIGVGINDPDIVVIPFTGIVVAYLVVYEQAGQILAQDWTYNPAGGGTLNPGIIVTICSGGCSNPNIDAVSECGFGIVYEKGGEIRGRFGSLGPLCPTASFPSNLNAEVLFSACTPSGNSEPDISLFHDGVNTMANVVYINKIGSTKSLVIQRHLIADFITATPVSCANNQVLLSVPLPNENLRAPRIASVDGLGSHDSRDCQIVVAHTVNLGPVEEILGYNHRLTAHGPNVYNQTNLCITPMPIQTCLNRRPVVAFTSCDRYMVEWEYAGNCLFGLTSSIQNILTKKLDISGAFIGTDYALSNYYLTTSANIPSVCGRYVLNPVQGIESLHVNPFFQQMLVKSTTCNIADLAKHQPTDDTRSTAPNSIVGSNFRAFPNPFGNRLNFEFDITNSVDSYSVEIMDMQGRLVHSFSSDDLKLGLNHIVWNSSEEVSGTYFVRVSSPDGVFMSKAIKMN